MSTRRNFITCLSLFGPAATLLNPIDSDIHSSDIGLLVFCIDVFGAEDTAKAILQFGTSDIRLVKRHLNKCRNQSIRLKKRSERRESHAGNSVLFHGAINIPDLEKMFSINKTHNKTHNRRTVLTGFTDHQYVIRSIPIESVMVTDYIESSTVITQQPIPTNSIEERFRNVILPSRTRVLLDLRRGIGHSVWKAEVVQTNWGQTRLHLWQTNRTCNNPDSLPYISGGVAYSKEEERITGLLGLPL
jgi:hypothetical protein